MNRISLAVSLIVVVIIVGLFAHLYKRAEDPPPAQVEASTNLPSLAEGLRKAKENIPTTQVTVQTPAVQPAPPAPQEPAAAPPLADLKPAAAPAGPEKEKVPPVTMVNAPKDQSPTTNETVVHKKQDRLPASKSEEKTESESEEEEVVVPDKDIESEPAEVVVHEEESPVEESETESDEQPVYADQSANEPSDEDYRKSSYVEEEEADDEPFTVLGELGKRGGLSHHQTRRWCPPRRLRHRNWAHRNYGGFNARTGVPPWISTGQPRWVHSGYGPARRSYRGHW